MSMLETVPEERDPVHHLSVVVASEPDMLKLGFSKLIDALVDQTNGVLLDWGTIEVGSQRFLHATTGQELTRILVALRGMDLSNDA